MLSTGLTVSTAEYRTKPQRLISHCLGHEGKGSVLALLKQKGWATELEAGTADYFTFIALPSGKLGYFGHLAWQIGVHHPARAKCPSTEPGQATASSGK